MEKENFNILYRTEKKYWWFVGQRYLITRLFKRYYNCKKNLVLLDVGCGTGINVKFLAKWGVVYGIDISKKAIHFCKLRKISNVKQSNVLNLDFEDSSFDVVTALGVFYHRCVENDVKGLGEIYRVLKPGGRVFFTDSAMPCLYGKHDASFHSIRRYTKNDLLFKFAKVGFIVEKISYFNSLFFPIIYLSRKLNNFKKSKPRSEVNENISPIINYSILQLYKLELYLMEYVNYWFGVNIVLVGRKPL